MEIGGNKLYIYNFTDDTIKDLYLIFPNTDKGIKMSKIKKNRNTLFQLQSKYNNTLKFYFKDSPNDIIVIDNVLDNIIKTTGMFLVNNSGIYLRVVIRDNKRVLEYFNDYEEWRKVNGK